MRTTTTIYAAQTDRTHHGVQQLRYAGAQESSEELARRNSKLSSALMEMQAKQATGVKGLGFKV